MSEGFTAEWLALREPADHAARSPELTAQLAAWSLTQTMHAQTVLHTVDLGCGTGSNLRFLAPHLGARQRWRLLDQDEKLLRVARERAVRQMAKNTPPLPVETETADLTDLRPVFARPVQLVTASALLDLSAAPWLEELAAGIVAARAAALFVLNYDGRGRWHPQHPLDDAVLAALNRHQQLAKGLGGPALGPEAGTYTAQLLRDAGMQVATARSDWRISPTQPDLQHALLAHWIHAAEQEGSLPRARVDAWSTERRRHIDAGSSHVEIGHVDVLALPAQETP